MHIRDRQIRAFTQALETSGQRKIDDENVLQLLASVGDGWFSRDSDVLAKLTVPGVTREQQLELAKDGMSGAEKEDIEKILDASGYDMTPAAKNFLEALVGRAPLDAEHHGPLVLVGDQSDGLVGRATPGASIEAINLSTAPEARLHLEDTTAIGRADEFGKFKGSLPDIQEGDLVRLRERQADGTVGNWITVRARGLAAKDTRNAEVNLERIDLVAHDDGTVDLVQNTDRPVSEPGAKMRIKNLSSGEITDVIITEQGGLPEALKVAGKPGDRYEVAISDGRNNVELTETAGIIKVPGGSGGDSGVDLDDPDVLARDKKADGTPKYAKERYTGPLFIDGPQPADVRQGAIGDCYFPAALAAVAHTDPAAIRDMIKENADGTYTVRFFTDLWRTPPKKVEIKVDGDLWSRSWGGPVYGSSLGGSTDKEKMELWFPLVEKAYAQWKGGYETIGQGGISGDVMAACIGREDRYTWLSNANADSVFKKIQEAADKGWPATAGTHGKDRSDLYTNTGVYANHAYSVLGVEEDNGTRYVKLRNPWGQSEAGYDGKNDGFFRLELDKFLQLYSSLSIVPA